MINISSFRVDNQTGKSYPPDNWLVVSWYHYEEVTDILYKYFSVEHADSFSFRIRINTEQIMVCIYIQFVSPKKYAKIIAVYTVISIFLKVEIILIFKCLYLSIETYY